MVGRAKGTESPAFGMAIRTWARGDANVEDVMHRVDNEWINLVQLLFSADSYDASERLVRARVVYFHQVGYHALALREPQEERLRLIPYYYKVLMGREAGDNLLARCAQCESGEPATPGRARSAQGRCERNIEAPQKELTGVMNDLLTQREHPLRRALIDELHVRRFPSFSAPARITQLVMYEGGDGAVQSRQCAEALCALWRRAATEGSILFRATRAQALRLGVDTEFSTWSFIESGEFEHPFERPVFHDLPRDWLESLPGQTIRATQIAVVDRHRELSPEWLQSLFDLDEAVCCDVRNRQARIWSNFRVHADGFGRLLIHDRTSASRR